MENKEKKEKETPKTKNVKASSPSAKNSATKKSIEEIAVITSGNKQFIVKENSIIDVEKIEETSDKSISIEDVLLIHDGKKTQVGTPFIKNASVTATILEHLKDKKKIVFKFKNKTGYKKKQGHRQQLTRIKITGIKQK